MSRNLLDSETSPYLLLHKDNPVHWRPWGPEALAEAESSGKPILLSVGYTACHWCHVMNEESFADAETAELLNALYIPIKVDREERPDIDQIYQAAANALGNNGGWPLTMFLTPQAEPYFAATYLPREERFGSPAFKTVLRDVSRIYADKPEPVAQTTIRVQDMFAQLWSRDLSGELDGGAINIHAIHIAQRFDIFYGGLTGAPKFPTTGLLELLWRAYLRTGADQFRGLTYTALNAMCMGGIYDHVGGGFARYATDERWLIPHFEKMLADNAQLVEILTLVWQHDRSPLYRERIEETIAWVLRDMKVEEGFATSIDADSEGEEGKYYLWTEAEIDAALKGTYAARFKELYNVLPQGNYINGANILHRFSANPSAALSQADMALLQKQRSLMLDARSKRVAPMRDDKVLADWNGLMIAALAHAGTVFRRTDWLATAIKAYDFVRRTLGEGARLHHSWRAGSRNRLGFLDDHAHMSRAALALFEATADKRFLADAQGWVRTLNEHYWDMQNGGYFYTSDEADPLIARPRMIFDQAMPCGNGTMLEVLARLFFVTADNSYRDRCNGLIQAFSGEMARVPVSMGTYINGLEYIMGGLQIVIVGPPGNPKTQELVGAVLGRSLPNKCLLVVDPAEALPEGHPAFGKTMLNGAPAAYLCQYNSCPAPIANPVHLSQVLQLPPQANAAVQQQAAQQQAMQQRPQGSA